MSKYTTEIRFLCEVNAGLVESVGYAKIEEIIQKAAPKIFDFDFPIFDESYRTVLETKILRHFYTREICCETVGLWKLYLCDKLNMIMPYYNQLYKSELLEFNPLYDVDITRERDVTGSEDKDNTVTETLNQTEKVTDEQTSSNNSTSKYDFENSESGTNLNLFSDTPQGGINNVEEQDYLTNITKDSNDGNSSGNSNTVVDGSSNFNGTSNKTKDDNRNVTGNETIATTEKYLEKVSGKQGSDSYSELILKYRQTFLNIDQMVINELETLFMGIW